MIQEQKSVVVAPAVKESVAVNVAATPQAIPAIVDSSNTAAPVVLSQASPMTASDAKPVVDKVSSVVVSALAEKK